MPARHVSWLSPRSSRGGGAHLEMAVHDTAALEIVLCKVDNDALDAGRLLHELLLILDVRVVAEALALLRLGPVELGVQLLDALLSEGVDGGGVLERLDQRVLVVGVVLGRVEQVGHLRIES